MTRKPPTMSEQAYRDLDMAKGKNESPTKVNRKPTRKKSKRSLLEYVRSIAPNNQLADSIEKVLKKRNSIHLRTARMNAVRKRDMIKAAKSTDRLRELSKTPCWSGASEIRKRRNKRPKLSWSKTVVRDGKITIPAELRKKHGIRPGMKIGFADTPNGLLLKPVKFKQKVRASEIDELLYRSTSKTRPISSD